MDILTLYLFLICLSEASALVSNKIDNTSEECYHKQSQNYCPEGFELLSLKKGLCYVIKRAQTFPPKCDIPDFLPFDFVESYLRGLNTDVGFWINAFKNDSSGFPHLEWFESGDYYGTTFNYNLLANPNESDKKCVIFKNGNIKLVSCAEKFDTVCSYSLFSFKHWEMNKLCNNGSYNWCVISDYDLRRPTCFCANVNQTCPLKTCFCDKLAEPQHPFQSHFLNEYLSSSDVSPNMTCWIGLQKTKYEYQWISSGNTIGYTAWAQPENCSAGEGAFKFTDAPYSGWLMTEGPLMCALCEIQIKMNKLSMTLWYDEDINELKLVINNAKVLKQLICFRDSNLEDFKENITFFNFNLLKDRVTKVFDNLIHYPSYYWCHAFAYNSDVPVSSNRIIAFNKIIGYGNEFSLLLQVKEESQMDPFLNNFHSGITRKIYEIMRQCYKYLDNIRPMRGKFFTSTRSMELLLHITTLKEFRPAFEEYQELQKCLKAIPIHYPTVTNTSLTSSEFCLASETYTADNIILMWPTVRIGVVTIPENRLCLNEKQNMLPVRRKCSGNFLTGAEWDEVIGDCSATTSPPINTARLFQLLNSNTTNDLYTKLKKITENHEVQTSIDVFLISSIVKKFLTQLDKSCVNIFSSIIDDLMSFKKTVLSESQSLLNSTDELLSSIDNLFCDVSPILSKTDKLIVQISNYSDGVIGLALYRNRNSSDGNFQGYHPAPLYRNTSIDNILADINLELVVFLPFAINFLRHKLVIKIFQNDLLFNDPTNHDYEANGMIISVMIPGYRSSLHHSLTIAVNLRQGYDRVTNCSHWLYGIDSNLVSIYGSWKMNSKGSGKTNLVICEYNHMTHFALLLQHDHDDNENVRNIGLEISIGIGSGLSIVCVVPIFLSALTFKSWINRTGNIILTNFCLAIFVQSTLTFLLYANSEGDAFCSAVGAFLHYADLCEFSWMLVIAFLQYKRFVVVFNKEEKYILLKSLVVGWVIPLLPVVVTLSISVRNYTKNGYGYCYVTGSYLFYSSLFPIFIILIANLIIFIAIMWNVWKRKTNEFYNSPNYKLQILLAIFLFFSLGLTWFFGVAGAFSGVRWLTYVFCTLTSIRGVIIFLFFVAGNKELRELWMKRFRYYVEFEVQESSVHKTSNSVISSRD